MPVGRPSKYRKEMCDRVIEFGKEGMSKHEMALELGIHYSNFDQWQKDKPEFRDAVKEAVNLSQGFWERAGRNGALGKIQGFNATGYIFQMKNRFAADWREKQEVKHEGGISIVSVDSTDEQL